MSAHEHGNLGIPAFLIPAAIVACVFAPWLIPVVVFVAIWMVTHTDRAKRKRAISRAVDREIRADNAGRKHSKAILDSWWAENAPAEWKD